MYFLFNKDDSINRNKAFVTSPKEAPCEGDMTAFITDKSQINIDQLDCCHVLFISARVYKRTRSIKKRKRKRFHTTKSFQSLNVTNARKHSS